MDVMRTTAVTAEPRWSKGTLSEDDERGMRAMLAGVLAGLLVAATMVTYRTEAAFTASTVNPGSAWAAGSVSLSDDDTAEELISASGLLPGDTFERCIRVIYDGSAPAEVRLYATSASGAVMPYIGLTIEQANPATNVGSNAGGCAGFGGTQIYSGTAANLMATTTTFESGLGSFAPTGTGQYRVYRFVGTLDPAAPNSVQGASAVMEFTWEARS